jgi:hypothetical protein
MVLYSGQRGRLASDLEIRVQHTLTRGRIGVETNHEHGLALNRLTLQTPTSYRYSFFSPRFFTTQRDVATTESKGFAS